jgi:erythromycin esterase-like protein
MLHIPPPKTRQSKEDGDRIAVLREHAEPLPPPESRDFARPFDRFGSAKLVVLGEATHGVPSQMAGDSRGYCSTNGA